MPRWPHVTVVLDPALAAELSRLGALPVPVRPPSSRLLRDALRSWLAERGVIVPPSAEPLSPAERAAMGVKARARKKSAGTEKGP